MYRLVNSPSPQEGYTGDYCELYTAYEVNQLLANKQGTLTAGEGVSITNNVIAVTLAALLDDTSSSSTTTYSSEKIEELIANIDVEGYTVADPLVLVDHQIRWPSISVPSGTYGSATAVPVVEVTDYGLISSISTTQIYPPTTPGAAGQYYKSKGTGGGEWQTPADTITSSNHALVTAAAVYAALQEIEVPTYSAGSNITITDNVISSNQINDLAANTTTTYSSTKIQELLGEKQDELTAGDNITITGGVVSSNQIYDNSSSTTKTYSSAKIESIVEGKQDTLSAGSNITITGSNEISSNQIDDSNSSTVLTYSSSKLESMFEAVTEVLDTKQEILSANSPIDIVSGVIIMEDSGVVAETYGSADYGDATMLPIVRVDRFGRVIDATTTQIYPPIDAGTTGQYWKSDGSGRGRWASPARTLTDSELAIPSSAAVLEYITAGSVTILTYQGPASSEGSISTDPSAGWFYVATQDFTFNSQVVHHGDWLVYNHDSEDYETNRWYIWNFGNLSAQSVNGLTGDILLYGDNITLSSGSDVTVTEKLTELDTEVGDLTNLSTEAKTDLVSAINEVAAAKQDTLVATAPLVLEEDEPEAGTSTLSATFDTELTEDSENFVSSGLLYTETYPDVKAYDSTGTAIHETKMVHLTSAEYAALVEAGTVDSKTYYNITDDQGGETTNLMSMFLGLYSYSPASWDLVPTAESTKPVTSNGIYEALQSVRDAAIQVLTELPDRGQSGTIYYVYDPVSEGYNTYVWDEENSVFTTVGAAALSLTMDSAPTRNSTNAATSGGIFNSIANTVKAYDSSGEAVEELKIVCLTQTEYDNLAEKDNNTLYFTKED